MCSFMERGLRIVITGIVPLGHCLKIHSKSCQPVLSLFVLHLKRWVMYAASVSQLVVCVCVCVCVYVQVKFMKSVPGTALVEMGDEYAVDRAITHLNSIKVFGKRLNVWWEVEHTHTHFVLFSFFIILEVSYHVCQQVNVLIYAWITYRVIHPITFVFIVFASNCYS